MRQRSVSPLHVRQRYVSPERLHDFVMRRDSDGTPYFACEKCDGRMNQVGEWCNGKADDQPR